jgi:hypothetical protein
MAPKGSVAPIKFMAPKTEKIPAMSKVLAHKDGKILDPQRNK